MRDAIMEQTMPYAIQTCATPLAIPERSYASAPVVWFTRFSSCIGILALSPQRQVFALHLALYDGDTLFGASDVATVAAAMQGCARGSVKVIGQISAWQRSVPAAYTALVQKLTSDFGAPEDFPLGDGIYGAELDGGRVELTYR